MPAKRTAKVAAAKVEPEEAPKIVEDEASGEVEPAPAKKSGKRSSAKATKAKASSAVVESSSPSESEDEPVAAKPTPKASSAAKKSTTKASSAKKSAKASSAASEPPAEKVEVSEEEEVPRPAKSTGKRGAAAKKTTKASAAKKSVKASTAAPEPSAADPESSNEEVEPAKSASKRGAAAKKTAKASAAAKKTTKVEPAPVAAPVEVESSEDDLPSPIVAKKAAKRASVAKKAAKASAASSSEEKEEPISAATTSSSEDSASTATSKSAKATSSAKRGSAKRASKATSASNAKTASIATNALNDSGSTPSSLGGISLDVARELWAYLDVNALALLHCTFDRSIQRLMHSRGAVERAIVTSATNIPVWQVRYFLMSLQDVGLLHLEFITWTSELMIKLLRNVNPRELVFGKNLIPYSIHKKIRSKERLPEDERAIIDCYTDSSLPNFALLTPNLRRLRFNDDMALFSEVEGHRMYNDDGGPIWYGRGGNTGSFIQYSTGPSFVEVVKAGQVALSLPPSLTTLEFGDILPDAVRLLVNSSTIVPVTLGTLKLPSFYRARTQLSSHDLLADTFERFPHLQSFTLQGHVYTSTNRKVNVPQALNYLSAGDFIYYPLEFLTAPSLRTANLTTLNLDMGLQLPTWANADGMNTHPSVVDFAACLPPTLRTLNLQITSPAENRNFRLKLPVGPVEHRVTISRLPPQITKLGLTFHCIPHPPLLRALRELDSLESLTLDVELEPAEFELVATRSAADPQRLFALTELPLNLKSLALKGKHFNLSKQPKLIPAFPASLESLSVSADLTWARQFRASHPQASITLTNKIDTTISADGTLLRSEFPDYWVNSFDKAAHERAVTNTYSAQKIYFKLAYSFNEREYQDLVAKDMNYQIPWDQLPRLPRYPTVLSVTFTGSGYPGFDALHYAFPKLRKLVLRCPAATGIVSNNLPSNLVHLELFNVRLFFRNVPDTKRVLPESLTYIQSNLEFDTDKRLLSFNMFPFLRHLDAPWWNFRVTGISKWTDKGMDRLATHLSGLKDVEWADFLKSKFHPKTLSNMHVSFTFTHTGGLLPKKGPAALKNATVNERRQATQIALAVQLQSTMVDFEVPGATPKAPSTRVRQPLSKTVYEMTADVKESPKFE